MSKKIKLGNLGIEIVETIDTVTYILNGDVDEHFLQKDVPRIQKQTIIFDLENISNFNSCGIREWLYFIVDVSRLGNIIFKNCSVTMVDQINMVPDSLGNGTVDSFFAPYYCSCSGEVTRHIEIEEHLVSLEVSEAPEFNCGECNEPLEFDALEESYFLFINAKKNLDVAS